MTDAVFYDVAPNIPEMHNTSATLEETFIRPIRRRYVARVAGIPVFVFTRLHPIEGPTKTMEEPRHD